MASKFTVKPLPYWRPTKRKCKRCRSRPATCYVDAVRKGRCFTVGMYCNTCAAAVASAGNEEAAKRAARRMK